MKIAFVVNTFPSVSETFIENQITGLLDRGHDVQVFAHAPGRAGVHYAAVERYGLMSRTHYLLAPQNKFVRIRSAWPLIANGLRRQPAALLRLLNPFTHGLEALSLTLLHQAAPFLRDFDILHCQFGPNGNFGARLKALGVRGKLVTTFHGYDIRLGLERGGAIYQELFALGDCFLSIAESNRAQLLAWGVPEHKIVTHPVGIDLQQFVFHEPEPRATVPQPVRVATVARLVPEKGLVFALQALALVRARCPDLALEYHVIGDGPLHDELLAHIRRLGLEGTVRLRGAQTPEGVREILRQSHLFLLPSVSEVLPVALMEAQALGLPVIATRVGSTGQVVNDGGSGVLVPPGDAEALAGALLQLCHAPQCWAEFARAGRRHVAEHFDVDQLNDRLIQIYERLIDGGRT